MRTTMIVVLLSMALLSTAAMAEVPGLISYQGTLTGASGVALDTVVAMTFTIYTDSTGGSAEWTETQSTVDVNDGMFDVLLGRVNPLSAAVFDDPELWLGVQVGLDTELIPRQRIATVGYAFRAIEADTADYARSAAGAVVDSVIYADSSGYADVAGSAPMPDSVTHAVFSDTSDYAAVAPMADSVLFADSSGYADVAGLAPMPDSIMYADSSGHADVAGYAQNSAPDGDWTVSGSDLYSAVSGNVGIGISTPNSRLDVRGANIDDGAVFKLSNSDRSHFIDVFPGRSGDPNPYVQWKDGDPLRFSTDGGGWSEKMRINSDGNVGIGTASPSSKLDVTGDVNINSAYKIGGTSVLSNAGSDNIFVGAGAGASTTGGWNTYVGDESGLSNTTGEHNTFLGRRSGYSNSTGLRNTFVGDNSGRQNTSGNYNTSIGYGAGYSNVAGNNNVFIGYYAGYGETGSEKLYIANGTDSSDVLIYGDFSTGRVGIGTLGPDVSLDVRGSNPDDGAVFKVGNSDGSHRLQFYGGRQNDPNPYIWWKDGDPLRFVTDAGGWSEKMRINSDGNVGIGTAGPVERLHVRGPTPAVLIDDSGGGNAYLRLDPAGYHEWEVRTGANGFFIKDVTAGSDYAVIKPDGKVGIGTTSPSQRLEVNGNAHVDGDLTWMAQEGYISLSAAAFRPWSNNITFGNNGAFVTGLEASGNLFVAPVQLPHGATVTMMTFFFSDSSSTKDPFVTLYRNSMVENGLLVMATLSPSGSGGDGSMFTSSIDYADVDNSQYCYFLSLNCGDPDWKVKCYGVIIKYTFSEPY